MAQTTLRRSLEQCKHCLEEALSVLAEDEHPQQALDDCRQAQELLLIIVKELKERT